MFAIGMEAEANMPRSLQSTATALFPTHAAISATGMTKAAKTANYLNSKEYTLFFNCATLAANAGRRGSCSTENIILLYLQH